MLTLIHFVDQSKKVTYVRNIVLTHFFKVFCSFIFYHHINLIPINLSFGGQTLFVSDNYFTAVDLSDIARDLDKAELAALNNTDETAARNSQNMDDTGFFSVQVRTSFYLQNSAQLST